VTIRARPVSRPVDLIECSGTLIESSESAIGCSGILIDDFGILIECRRNGDRIRSEYAHASKPLSYAAVLRGVPSPEESVTAGDTIAVDPSPHHSLQGARYELVGTWRGNATVRVPPFEAPELEVGALWAGDSAEVLRIGDGPLRA
jgi:hypothetical protein